MFLYAFQGLQQARGLRKSTHMLEY